MLLFVQSLSEVLLMFIFNEPAIGFLFILL